MEGAMERKTCKEERQKEARKVCHEALSQSLPGMVLSTGSEVNFISRCQ